MENLQTHFASPFRTTEHEIYTTYHTILKEDFLITVLNAFPDIVMVLDKNRQIVFYNQKLSSFLGNLSEEKILGKRPGEIFQCIHSCQEDAGCGTSDFCKECGAVGAILNVQDQKQNTQECRMIVSTEQGETSLDLRVWARPLDIFGKEFTIFTIRDISDEKRREALERTFFHDVLNHAALLNIYVYKVQKKLASSEKNIIEKIKRYSERLIDEIKTHRDLLAAEKGELIVSFKEISVEEILKSMVSFYQEYVNEKECKIEVKCPKDATMKTDPALLGRVIGNLVKNALEASDKKGVVKVGYENVNGKKIIFVNNQGIMPENVQLQIFQRSFSTKGKGRGIGTYSAKLLTERYLQGKILFISTEGAGTTFFLEFPEK